MDSIQKRISHFLASQRKRAGLSIEEAAAQSSLPPQRIEHYENGTNVPLEDIHRLAIAYQVPLAELNEFMLMISETVRKR